MHLNVLWLVVDQEQQRINVTLDEPQEHDYKFKSDRHTFVLMAEVNIKRITHLLHLQWMVVVYNIMENGSHVYDDEATAVYSKLNPN